MRPTLPLNFTMWSFYHISGFVIYPGKVSNANCFRIGNIGHLFPDDMTKLVKGIREVMTEMKIPLPFQD